MHEGTIAVKSEVSKGTEFIIELLVRLVCNERNTSEERGLYNVERIHIEFSDIYL
jgi:hypothetical protein